MVGRHSRTLQFRLTPGSIKTDVTGESTGKKLLGQNLSYHTIFLLFFPSIKITIPKLLFSFGCTWLA